ncbi:alpha/beta hydrolase [Planotetraspora sp. A-T 1434]|uniref:alpha/beta fold hydrolase n=1 Tax=Planotetraspora sp. A-T 1434 TaxID=2979219 RepID=UPI0021BF9363|nr:alpha/beta hydrolase [Planotetraspora sp. A-T 1434]MCT9934236.1 alpha/beta hydrolase [Planotetraspora sp. A-T 1434]
MTDVLVAPDGRRLAVQQQGEPDGHPVFLLHGTPGSRVGPSPRPTVLYRLGIRLISFDRPGYGLSDRLPGRSVADVAADVAAIADGLGIARFAVVGRSGGAPHALACAALLPQRLTRVAALVGLAPRGAEGLDWFDGMAHSNVVEYTMALAGHRAVASRLATAAAQIRADPASKVVGLSQQVPESDRRVVTDHGIRRMLVRNFAEGLRDSIDGWVDDVLAFCGGWGFDPAVIEVPTLVWHGENDVFSPVGHARWLGERIPAATVKIQHGVAHFGAIGVLPEVLLWLVRK